eukprot:365634-Chlamydomonas_euryale.AAC.9
MRRRHRAPPLSSRRRETAVAAAAAAMARIVCGHIFGSSSQRRGRRAARRHAAPRAHRNRRIARCRPPLDERREVPFPKLPGRVDRAPVPSAAALGAEHVNSGADRVCRCERPGALCRRSRTRAVGPALRPWPRPWRRARGQAGPCVGHSNSAMPAASRARLRLCSSACNVCTTQ